MKNCTEISSFQKYYALATLRRSTRIVLVRFKSYVVLNQLRNLHDLIYIFLDNGVMTTPKRRIKIMIMIMITITVTVTVTVTITIMIMIMMMIMIIMTMIMIIIMIIILIIVHFI